ncbi:hypothetical protein NE237_005502 [Protea cynaroides]|uniref:Uncharacterized protein n=1 Tax=Protea cynaroides TaxID=273540 RepID=A0A9Q0QUI0_9MAGN|nr:hypothetical protein NE237_005502 [Protea cynaroides]
MDAGGFWPSMTRAGMLGGRSGYGLRSGSKRLSSLGNLDLIRALSRGLMQSVSTTPIVYATVNPNMVFTGNPNVNSLPVGTTNWDPNTLALGEALNVRCNVAPTVVFSKGSLSLFIWNLAGSNLPSPTVDMIRDRDGHIRGPRIGIGTGITIIAAEASQPVTEALGVGNVASLNPITTLSREDGKVKVHHDIQMVDETLINQGGDFTEVGKKKGTSRPAGDKSKKMEVQSSRVTRQGLSCVSMDDPQQWWRRKERVSPLQSICRQLLFIMPSVLWKARNDTCFDNRRSSISRLIGQIVVMCHDISVAKACSVGSIKDLQIARYLNLITGMAKSSSVVELYWQPPLTR